VAEVDAETGADRDTVGDPAFYNDDGRWSRMVSRSVRGTLYTPGWGVHSNRGARVMAQLGFTPGDDDLPPIAERRAE